MINYKINIKRSAQLGIEFIVKIVFEFFSRNQKGKMKSIYNLQN
jgi:hypothetical protein